MIEKKTITEVDNGWKQLREKHAFRNKMYTIITDHIEERQQKNKKYYIECMEYNCITL